MYYFLVILAIGDSESEKRFPAVLDWTGHCPGGVDVWPEASNFICLQLTQLSLH